MNHGSTYKAQRNIMKKARTKKDPPTNSDIFLVQELKWTQSSITRKRWKVLKELLKYRKRFASLFKKKLLLKLEKKKNLFPTSIGFVTFSSVLTAMQAAQVLLLFVSFFVTTNLGFT